jgi:hypothetical protein
VLPKVDSAAVIANIWRFKWRTIVHEKNLVFVLVLTQMQMLRLPDGSEDNLLRCRKQEAPPPWRQGH